MLERITVFLINIFCPPLSVMLVAGPGMDCLINTLLFIAGVIPGHLHGFYITCTYFSRKRKVRKGRYPGGRKSFIYSHQVWNGGASDERVRELWKEKCRAESGVALEGAAAAAAARGRKEKRKSGRCGGSRGSRGGGSGDEVAWDGRRESKRASTRVMSSSAGTSSVRGGHAHGRSMTEVKGWRM